MKINVKSPLYNLLTGEVMKKQKTESITLPNGQTATRSVEIDDTVTFRSAVMACLYAHDTELKDKDKKADRFELAMLVNDNDELEFTDSQITTIKEAVHQHEGVMIYGQINRLLKGEVIKKTEDGDNRK